MQFNASNHSQSLNLMKKLQTKCNLQRTVAVARLFVREKKIMRRENEHTNNINLTSKKCTEPV